jgi:hypothetical protein
VRREARGARADAGLTTTERGYGTAHQKLRKRLAAQVARGGVLCARCGRPIEPGMPWDLGHNDFDRSVYNGPEHASCNRRTSQVVPGPAPRRQSRRW